MASGPEGEQRPSPRGRIDDGICADSCVMQDPLTLHAGPYITTPLEDYATINKNDDDPGNFGESPIPRCGRRAGRNRSAVRYTIAPYPDKLRPCKHWCVVQPAGETGSGQV
jgi:hypothetical protein